MKEHKVIITDKPEIDLDKWLSQGWLVKNVTALHVTAGDHSLTQHGKASYVLEKQK